MPPHGDADVVKVGGRLMARDFYFARTGGSTHLWHLVAERAPSTRCGRSAVAMPFKQDGIPTGSRLCPDCTAQMFTVLREA